MSTASRFACALLVAAVTGCGDPLFGTDGGDSGHEIDGGPMGDAGMDADMPDETAPTVIATIPVEGDVEVSPSTSIRVVFSEQVDEDGTVELFDGAVAIALGAPSFTDDARELTVSSSAALPANATLRVVIDGFADLAGNTMSGPHEFTFTTSDPFGPSVTASTPAEGSIVDQATVSLVVDFSETMNAALGVAVLDGGPGTIGAPVWEGGRATFALSGLAADTAYRIELVGFADPAGNPLDEEAYLGDGAIDFTTSADMIAPRVTESSPREGATDVPPTRTTRVRVDFSEPMDTTAGTATLGIDTLTASWQGGGRILLLDVVGRFQNETPYSIALDGFTDRAGNALDETTYLIDGALDFTTSEDELPPFVLMSDPADGSTGIRWTEETLFVTFSEAMDTTSVSVPYTDGEVSGALSGTWSSGGALLTLDVDLTSGRTYVLDFRGFHDADGLPLDATHGYLGDGRLTFTTATPIGENCQDFLTHAQATTSTDGSLVWTIANGQVDNVDGAAPCDISGGSADAVIRYRKTTPDSTAAAGGHVLRITVTNDASFGPEVNVDILRDACDPRSGASARLECRTNAEPQVIELDVSAGDYFVWVAATDGTWSGTTTVEIEEVPAGLGDTCANAIPITAGTTAITPTGTHGIQAPSCLGPQVTWYRYTTSQGMGIVSFSPGRGAGSRDPQANANVACRTGGELLPVLVPAGRSACIAVVSGTATSITIEERPYDGVRGIPSSTGITSTSAPTLTFVAVSPTRLYTESSTNMLVAPRTGGPLVSWAPGPSLPGEQGLTIGDSLYTISRSPFSMTTPNSLVFRIVDDTGAQVMQPIDTAPAYATTLKLGSIVVDGTNFILAQDTATDTLPHQPTYFYSLPIAGGAPTLLGSNEMLQDVAAMAVDATYIYFTANISDEVTEGIYRLRRDELSNPAAVPFLVYSGGLRYTGENGAMYIDSSGTNTWMYFRTYDPADVHLLVDPDSASPRYLGAIWRSATGVHTGMAYDPDAPALFVVDRGTSPDEWVRID